MPFSLGLMALSASLVKEAQILAAWQSILKKIKKNGKCVLHGYPTSITTQRKDGGRMGGGKGVEKIFAWPAQPGKLFCEVVSLRPELAAQALRSAQQRLPIKTKIIRSH